jgi:hypothetical protein
MTVLLILCLLLAPFICPSEHESPESDRVKTLRSLKKLDEFPLYTMRFFGDYALPDFSPRVLPLHDTQSGNRPVASSSWACTCFSTKTERGSHLLGRNFDWDNHPALLLFTNPPGRYASVSMVDISYLGYSKSDDPGKNPGELFRAPLLPFDGMNDQGLAVGMMALSAADPPHDPQKQTVDSLLIIRLMLDHAKDVEGALALFEKFNIDFQGGPPLHYIITDRTGRSAVVEFVNRELSVLRNTQAWQVATNFTLTGRSPENSRAACWRYDRVWETLAHGAPAFSAAKALSLLKDVSQRNTIWSVVYDISSLEFLVVMGKKYDHVHEFNLKKAVSDLPPDH